MFRNLLLIVLVFASRCVAQTSEPSWYGSSYLSVPHGKSLVMEGAVAPSYEVLDWKRSSLNLKVVLTPEVLIQMSNRRSTPIYSPSYKPRISLLGRWQDGSVSIHPYLTFAHHSNGQDGPLFSDSGRINIKSGNFSTNYVQAGYFVSLASMPGHLVGVSLEFHPSKGLFSIDESIQGLYGRKRLSYQYQYIRSSIRFEASYIRILDNNAGAPRSITSMKLKWRVPGFRKMVWLFANYYEGQNYYNIFFREKLRQFKAGISLDAKFVSNKLVQID